MARIVITGILSVFSLFLSLSTYAQSYEHYVGDEVLLVAPTPPTGAIFQTAWAGKHKALQVTKDGTYGARVKITEYFSGVAQVQCDYYWYYYINGRQYTNHATKYYSIYCKQVKISLNKTSMSLTAGKGEYLSYTLSPSNVSKKPSITWKSSNYNIAEVNSSGYVLAKSAGTAVITVYTNQETSASCTIVVTADTPPSPPPSPPEGGEDEDDDSDENDDWEDGEEDDDNEEDDTGPGYLDYFLKVAKKRLNGLKIKWLDYL